MVFPFRFRTAHCGASILFVAVLTGTPSVACADTPAQRQQLAAALRQLDALERSVVQSESEADVAQGGRYYFDYPRLRADLDRVRIGIQDYLRPSRAQPRALTELSIELTGNYRADTSLGNTSMEKSP